MGCIWQEQRSGQWSARAVIAGKALADEELGVSGIAILGLGSSGGAALFVRPGFGVRINGEPVLGGLRILEHKDEILAATVRLCFSQETTPVVVTFATSGQRPPICPICRGPVRDGMQAVQCPGCGRWFHQRDAEGQQPAKPCWTYAPTCRFCRHPTSFAGDAAWRPDREDNLAQR
jgi:hypothetical protein